MQLALHVLEGSDKSETFLTMYRETYGDDPDENPFEEEDDVASEG